MGRLNIESARLSMGTMLAVSLLNIGSLKCYDVKWMKPMLMQRRVLTDSVVVGRFPLLVSKATVCRWFLNQITYKNDFTIITYFILKYLIVYSF